MAVSVQYFVRSGIGGSGILAGSTTPPTPIQAGSVYAQKAVVVFTSDLDAQALFTHNWGLDASAPVFFDPQITHYMLLGGPATTFLPAFTFDVSNTNVVKINKPAQGGTSGTYVVTLRKPHSVGQ